MRATATFTIGTFTGTYNPEIDLYFGPHLVTITNGVITRIGRYTIVGNQAFSKRGAVATFTIIDNKICFTTSGWFQMTYTLTTVNGYTQCQKCYKSKQSRIVRASTLLYTNGKLHSSSRYVQRNSSLPAKNDTFTHWKNGHIKMADYGTNSISMFVKHSSHSGNEFSTYHNGELIITRYAPVLKKPYYIQYHIDNGRCFYELDDIVLVFHSTPAGVSVHFRHGGVRSNTAYCPHAEYAELPMVGSDPGIFSWTSETTCMIMICGNMYSFNISRTSTSFTIQEL